MRLRCCEACGNDRNADLVAQAGVDNGAEDNLGIGVNSLGDEVRVTVIATGFAAQTLMGAAPAKPAASGFGGEVSKMRNGYAPTAAAKRHAERPAERSRPAPRPVERQSYSESTASEPVAEPRFTQRPVADAATLSEEELEIPAFLRKKMG
jgi:hypothetical protein